MERVPYNVTVFATNGRGRGPNVIKVAYAEGGGKYNNLIQATMHSLRDPHMNNSFLMYAN